VVVDGGGDDRLEFGEEEVGVAAALFLDLGEPGQVGQVGGHASTSRARVKMAGVCVEGPSIHWPSR
jgi:hypothetical protein